MIVAIGFFSSLGSNENETKSYNNSSGSGIYQAEACVITTCADGSCSTSTGRGTCSHHGGIRR